MIVRAALPSTGEGPRDERHPASWRDLGLAPMDDAGRQQPIRRHQPIRVVIVDDHQMVLDGLQAMLRPHGDDVQIVGATTDAG